MTEWVGVGSQCYVFAKQIYETGSSDKLESSHRPQDADLADCETWEITPLEWAMAIEAALRARKEHGRPDRYLIEWDEVGKRLGEEELLVQMGLT
ncbi:MAG: hypothetical protein P8182_13395 [Deltaproteobacteria bacterium]